MEQIRNRLAQTATQVEGKTSILMMIDVLSLVRFSEDCILN